MIKTPTVSNTSTAVGSSATGSVGNTTSGGASKSSAGRVGPGNVNANLEVAMGLDSIGRIILGGLLKSGIHAHYTTLILKLKL